MFVWLIIMLVWVLVTLGVFWLSSEAFLWRQEIPEQIKRKLKYERSRWISYVAIVPTGLLGVLFYIEGYGLFCLICFSAVVFLNWKCSQKYIY